MRITSLGAAREVTGSKHLLEANGSRILLDCGMFQGHRKESDRKNRARLPLPAGQVDAVVLSHAHIDHCGLLPLLHKQGFDGPIYATAATRDICAVMLSDSANIQERDAQWLAKKKRAAVEPLYSMKEANSVLRQFVSVPYRRTIKIARGVELTFHDAGHILGSALSFLSIEEHGETRTLLYSGDIGRRNHPMVNDPDPPPSADFVLMESTYGDREHEDFTHTGTHLAEIINRTADRGGKIIIPSFALERAQEVVYLLKTLEAENAIPHLAVFVDSPMAVNLTEVFRLHVDSFDDDFADMMAEEGDPFSLQDIRYVREVSRSIAINDYKGSCIIIAASGMCENGRIVHHLRNNCSDARNTILIVGYQAKNTLGRRIVEGQPVIRVMGDEYELNAEVEVVSNFSGHAGRTELLEFAQRFAATARKFMLVHGEDEAMESLRSEIASQTDAPVVMPEPGIPVELD